MYAMENYYTYILDIIAFHTFMKTIYFGMSLLQSGYPTFISLSPKKCKFPSSIRIVKKKLNVTKIID